MESEMNLREPIYTRRAVTCCEEREAGDAVVVGMTAVGRARRGRSKTQQLKHGSIRGDAYKN